jgi:retron-type reverse transcriptase
VTIDKFAEKSDWYLDRLHQKLKTDTYKPKPVEQVLIPKEGGQRRLGIPTIMDRVCQQALVNRMEPIFESKFLDCNFGYRKGKSPHDAMKKIWKELNQGCLWVVDADLRSYFDTIDQEKLIDLIAEEISDGRVLRLTRMMLQAGLMKGKSWEPT